MEKVFFYILLCEAQPKNALLPPPNLETIISIVHVPAQPARVIVNISKLAVIVLQFYNSQASLNHRENACSCSFHCLLREKMCSFLPKLITSKVDLRV
jgi:hypothetical protein